MVTMDGVNERYGVREERGDKEEVREGGEKREKIGGHVTQGEGMYVHVCNVQQKKSAYF